MEAGGPTLRDVRTPEAPQLSLQPLSGPQVAAKPDVAAHPASGHRRSTGKGFPAALIGGGTEARRSSPRHHRHMTYAVRWNEDDGPDHVGGLTLDRESLVLADAGGSSHEPALRLRSDELADIYLERRTGGSASGRPSLVLVTRGGTRLQIASLEGLGALHELAEQLTLARRA